MDLPPIPNALVAWAESQGLLEQKWRKPGIADYDITTDVWRVDDVVLSYVLETEDARYYYGHYEGPLESQPVIYWMLLSHAMSPAIV